MSRIKNIVEQGKQDLGLLKSLESDTGASRHSGGDRTGKLVHKYTQTASVAVPDSVLTGNRVISPDSVDLVAKRFHVLRTKVLQQMRKKGWNTLAISSPTAGAGKTLVAVNLAISMAVEGNQSVLLVDMNLSKPSVHTFFGLEPEFGIHDYIDGIATVPDILINPGIERLVILPGRKNLVNSSEQITTPLVKNLVSDLKSRYDSRIVIFDLPPIVNSDEVMVFLPYVDCSLLVVEAGKNTGDEVHSSLEAIGNNPLLGTVLNKCNELESSIKLPF